MSVVIVFISVLSSWSSSSAPFLNILQPLLLLPTPLLHTCLPAYFFTSSSHSARVFLSSSSSSCSSPFSSCCCSFRASSSSSSTATPPLPPHSIRSLSQSLSSPPPWSH